MSDTEKALDLDALRKLCAAATPGPWEAGIGWVYTMPIYGDSQRLSDVLGIKYAVQERQDAENERAARNINFICAARSAVPALIAEVERLTVERDRALAEVQEYRSAITWDVTCFNCSHLLDRCYEADCERDRARDVAVALEQQNAEARRLAKEVLNGANPRLPSRFVLITQLDQIVRILGDEAS